MDLIAIDDFLLSDMGIEPAPLRIESEYLGFGVERREGIRSSVFFGGSAEPARWRFLFRHLDTPARDALMSVLAVPRDQPLRLLVQRDPYGQELVTADAAVVQISPLGTFDNMDVDFEANDSIWLAQDAVVSSKTFTAALDQAMHVAVPGNVPTNAILRIVPDAQRTASTAVVGWKYRQRWTITNNADIPLFRYPLRIGLGSTTALVSGGKAQADGDDVRVWLDGLEQSRTLMSWNTASSFVWVVAPAIPAGGSITYDIVYGNPSATAAPQLVYPDLPAFDLALSGNTSWRYKTELIIGNLNKGLYYLSGSKGFVDMGVPGAWQVANTFPPLDNTDFVQARLVTSTPALTYQAMPRIARAKGDDLIESADVAFDNRIATADSAILYHPLGIVSINIGFFRRNVSRVISTATVTTTVGDTSTSSEETITTTAADGEGSWVSNVVIAREDGSSQWDSIGQNLIVSIIGSSIPAATYTPPTTVHEIGYGVWTRGRNSIPEEGEALIDVYPNTDTIVTIDASDLIITQEEPEVEIYELATELRLGGGGSAIPPYHTLLVGNARGASGAGTPRAAVKLTQGLQIDAEARTHTVWDADFTVQDEVLSAHAVRALKSYQSNGNVVEFRDSLWLPLTPRRSLIANSAFDVDIGSWEEGATTFGMTAAWEHDASLGGEQVGSLRATVGPNSAGVNADSQMIASRFSHVRGRECVQVAGWVRTSNANIRPLLQIIWYQDDADTAVRTDTETSWAPAINTPYRRVFAASVPVGATRYRIAVVARAASAGGTGTASFDDITVNDNDLFVADVSMGQLTVDALVKGRWS